MDFKLKLSVDVHSFFSMALLVTSRSYIININKCYYFCCLLQTPHSVGLRDAHIDQPGHGVRVSLQITVPSTFVVDCWPAGMRSRACCMTYICYSIPDVASNHLITVVDFLIFGYKHINKDFSRVDFFVLELFGF